MENILLWNLLTIILTRRRRMLRLIQSNQRRISKVNLKYIFQRVLWSEKFTAVTALPPQYSVLPPTTASHTVRENCLDQSCPLKTFQCSAMKTAKPLSETARRGSSYFEIEMGWLRLAAQRFLILMRHCELSTDCTVDCSQYIQWPRLPPLILLSLGNSQWHLSLVTIIEYSLMRLQLKNIFNFCKLSDVAGAGW